MTPSSSASFSASFASVLVSAPSCTSAPSACVERGASDACSYRVAWSINPHMRVGAADPRRAGRQHGAFVRLLKRLGATLRCLPFVHGAYDSVFMKDSAILVARATRAGDRGEREEALLTRPRHPERHAEQRPRAAALEALGIGVAGPPEVPLEGGDVAARPFGGAFLGHGFRSSPRAAATLERFLGAAVVPVELRDPSLYHLDMALAALSCGGRETLLVCEEALTAASMRDLERAAPSSDIARVPLEEARRFALNLVQVGEDVVLGVDSPCVAAMLRARGLRPHVAELGEFHKAGGSAACLTAVVHRQARVTESATAAMRSTLA